mmetsp:Transcript_30252/g.47390  ORF Transcript_30252/g.47390 Transcript_30252/m.47390 type:complete len:902 (+) Transcript_30252:266-2971(+)
MYPVNTGINSIMLGQVDQEGVDCGDSTAECPIPRRDAATAIIGNTGASNGKMLVFGGLTTNGASGIETYVDRTSHDGLVAMSDLWYLDLGGITDSCVVQADCMMKLPWTKIEVLGTQPSPRWGAGILLDPSDNLYVLGGVTTSASGQFVELEDLFVFQLRDPYYKRCSATGTALSAAVAGIEAVFYLQCRDAFDEPAAGAKFQVEIAGPVDMKPSVTNLGDGTYECRYQPAVASKDYTITIKVGRGGALYEDLIAGEDADAKNSIHEYTGLTASQNPFALEISPGATAPASSIAQGPALSLTTSGDVSTFTIFARDAFLNRRPGGDVVEAQFEISGSQAQSSPSIPVVSDVLDNSDGSYHASYSITRAGSYSLIITLNGKIGAGTPMILTVETGEAVIENTYFYGILGCVSTGKASNLFIQLSDRFGNPLRLDPAEVEAEEVVFEPCLSRGTNPASDAVCAGGMIDGSVSVQYDYGVGPGGFTVNPETKQPYHGLIRVTYFPFVDNIVIPEAKHRGVYVECFFPIAQDPAISAIRACREEVAQDSVLGNRRRLGVEPRRALKQAADSCEETSASRRNSQSTVDSSENPVSAIRSSERNMQIQASFQPPDQSLTRDLLVWIPVGTAILGAVIELVWLLFEYWNERKAAQNEKLFRTRSEGAQDDEDAIEDNDDSVQDPQKDASREALPVGTKPRSNQAIVSFKQEGSSEVKAMLDYLMMSKLLSPTEHAQAMRLANSGDPQVCSTIGKQAALLASDLRGLVGTEDAARSSGTSAKGEARDIEIHQGVDARSLSGIYPQDVPNASPWSGMNMVEQSAGNPRSPQSQYSLYGAPAAPSAAQQPESGASGGQAASSSYGIQTRGSANLPPVESLIGGRVQGPRAHGQGLAFEYPQRPAKNRTYEA